MISRLALGTVQFGLPYGIANQDGQVRISDASIILKTAKAIGLDTLDTAMTYGSSEQCLGRVGVSDWRVVTKLPSLPNFCLNVSSWVEDQVASSLQRLGVDHLYGLLLHNPNQLTDSRCFQLISALQSVKAIGLVKKIGVSVYSPEDLALTYSVFKPNLIQAPLNLVDRRLVNSGWLARLANDGVEVHTRSAFLQGLLLMQNIPSYFLAWKKLWGNWTAWRNLNPGHSISACLAYPLSFPEVSRVIVGVDNLRQFHELVQASSNLPKYDNLPNLTSVDPNLINPSNWKF